MVNIIGIIQFNAVDVLVFTDFHEKNHRKDVFCAIEYEFQHYPRSLGFDGQVTRSIHEVKTTFGSVRLYFPKGTTAFGKQIIHLPDPGWFADKQVINLNYHA